VFLAKLTKDVVCCEDFKNWLRLNVDSWKTFRDSIEPKHLLAINSRNEWNGWDYFFGM